MFQKTERLWPPTTGLLIAVAIAIVVSAPKSAAAATFMVTNTDDSGEGSLRAAMLSANVNPGVDTITFNLPGCPCTIHPISELPWITDPLILSGPGANVLTISGGYTDPETAAGSELTIIVVRYVTVELSGVTLASGEKGISNSGTLTVRDAILYANKQRGISNQGVLTVLDSTFHANGNKQATGAGIYTWRGRVVVRNSLFANNRGWIGGAIDSLEGTLTVVDSTFASNEGTWGGAISNRSGSTAVVSNSVFTANYANSGAGINNQDSALGINRVTVINSSFSDNSATMGAAIQNDGAVTVSNSTFARNVAIFAGAISSGHGTLTVRGSTFVGNHAQADTGATGAISNSFGRVVVSNSTFSANSAGGALAAGAISNHDRGSMAVSNSTLFGNSASGNSSADGIFNFGGGSVTVANTLIAGSSAGANCFGEPLAVESTTNMSDDASCGPSFVTKTAAEIKVGPLANRGGYTQTHSLLPGSVAIDVGNDAVCAAPPVEGRDQRGRPRPADGDGGGAVCDIGAVEFTPLDAMDELIDAVLRLVVGGALNDDQGSALIANFQYAKSTTAAMKGLDAFISEVDRLMAERALTSRDGRLLIDMAVRISASLGS